MDIKMDQSEATKAKFKACTGTMEYQINKWEQVEGSLNLDKNINVEAFKKMLIKNDMEEYFNLLINYLGFFQINHMLYVGRQENISKDDLEHKKDLTEALIFILSDEAGTNSSITFQKSKKSLTISNKNIIDSIIKGLVKEYELNDFNMDYLTDEELDEELEKESNQEWIEDWIREDKEHFENTNSDESLEYKTDYGDMAVKFWGSHHINRKVNLEFLERIKKENHSSKKKAGRKIKNRGVAGLVRGLSRLRKIDKFLSSSSQIIDIDEIPLTNKDCLFIHDCLAFFGLIEDYSKNKLNTTTPEKYIRTLLRQSPQPFDLVVNKNYRITKFCQLKAILPSVVPK